MRRKAIIIGVGVVIVLSAAGFLTARSVLSGGNFVKSKDNVRLELGFCVVDFNEARTGFRQRAEIYLDNKNDYPVFVSVTLAWKDGSYAKKDYEMNANGGPTTKGNYIYSANTFLADPWKSDNINCRDRIESATFTVSRKR